MDMKLVVVYWHRGRLLLVSQNLKAKSLSNPTHAFKPNPHDQAPPALYFTPSSLPLFKVTRPTDKYMFFQF